MEPLSVWRGKGVLAACIGVILTAWTASAAHADSLSIRLRDDASDRGLLTAGSPACEFAPTRAMPPKAEKAEGPPAVGNLLTLFVAGTVLFGDSPSDFTPSAPPPVDNPPAPVTPVTPSTPVTPPADGVVIIQGNPTPEPASLVIGLIGSACAGAVVWDRRRKRAGAA